MCGSTGNLELPVATEAIATKGDTAIRSSRVDHRAGLVHRDDVDQLGMHP